MKNLLIVGACVLYLGCIPVTLAAEQLKLVEHASNETLLDLGAKGDSTGDVLAFANPVFDASNKTQVGSTEGYCVRVVVGKSWSCAWTLMIKDGQITVFGIYQDAGESVLAVTGGTGKYSGAKGQLQLHSRGVNSSAYDFTYELN